MKKILCFLFCALAPLSGFSSISLSPFFLEFDADSPNRSNQVRFTNTSKTEKSYRINFVNFEQKSDGTYKTITEQLSDNPFADRFLEYSPRHVVLKPNESQVVRIKRKGMATETDTEYISHLLIQEEKPDKKPIKNTDSDLMSIHLTAVYGVSIPVMIHKGNLSSTAKISSTKIITNGNNSVANITVQRFGNRSFYGSVIVKDDDKEIGRISNFRILMTTQNRVIQVPLDHTPKKTVTIHLINEIVNETLEAKSI